MITLPAVCPNCTTIFPTGIVEDGGSAVIMGNYKWEPCPNCGSIGDIPDETYKLTETIMESLSAPQRTLDELKIFSSLLEKVRQKEMSVMKFVSEVEREIPELHPLLGLILQGNRKEKFSFGMKLLGVALAITIQTLENNQPTSELKPEIIINNVYDVQEFH